MYAEDLRAAVSDARLDLNNIDSSNFAVNLAGRVLQYGLIGAGSELRLDFVVGTNQRVAGEVVKPLGSSPIFVAPRPYFDWRGRNLYMDDVFVTDTGLRSSAPASISGPISDSTPSCGSATTSRTIPGDGALARQTCPTSTAPKICAPRLRHGHPDQSTRADARVPPSLDPSPVFFGADGEQSRRRPDRRQPAVVHDRRSADVLV